MVYISFFALIISLIQTRAQNCGECDTFQWDTCYWDWEAQWDECSWIWEYDNGVEPYDKQCVEELVSDQKNCLNAAGCFDTNNDDCYMHNNCQLYNCEQYTLCYQSYQKGCNDTRDFCQQSCGVDVSGSDGHDSDHYEQYYTDIQSDDMGYYDMSSNFNDDGYVNIHHDDTYDDETGDDTDYDSNDYGHSYSHYNNDEYSCSCGDGIYYDCWCGYNYDDYDSDDYGYSHYDEWENSDDYGPYDMNSDHNEHDSFNYGQYENYGYYNHYDTNEYDHYNQDMNDYGEYNNNYDSYTHYQGYTNYDDEDRCDCDEICGDVQEHHTWEYTYEEVPDCVKGNCNETLLTCANEENCVSAIEGVVAECCNTDNVEECIENVFIYNDDDTASQQRLQSFCGGNDEQCVADFKNLGECVINNECHKGHNNVMVENKLKAMVKGLKGLRRQKSKLKSLRGKEARIKSAKLKLAKRRVSRHEQVKRRNARKTVRKERRKLATYNDDPYDFYNTDHGDYGYDDDDHYSANCGYTMYDDEDDDEYSCDCGDGINFNCYCGDIEDDHTWEYTYDEVPVCVKEHCNDALLTCADEENCVSAMEHIVTECCKAESTELCVEHTFSDDTNAQQKLQNICGGNDEQCVADFKDLGECVINKGCHKGHNKVMVEKKLKGILKGLKVLRRQKLKSKSERSKEARKKSARKALEKRRFMRRNKAKRRNVQRQRLRSRPRHRTRVRRTRRKLVSRPRSRRVINRRRPERVQRMRKNRRSRERVQKHRRKQQKLKDNDNRKIRSLRKDRQKRRRGQRKIDVNKLSPKQQEALKKQQSVFKMDKKRFYGGRKERPSPTPAHLQRDHRAAPRRKKVIKKRESTLRNAVKSE